MIVRRSNAEFLAIQHNTMIGILINAKAVIKEPFWIRIVNFVPNVLKDALNVHILLDKYHARIARMGTCLIKLKGYVELNVMTHLIMIGLRNNV